MDVFVDTNVLFPFAVMDLMLALTEDAVHEVRWTDELLDEWERVIVRERGRPAESAARITAAIREFFPEGRVPDEYLCELIVDSPGEVVETVVRLAGEKKRPPLTPQDLSARLAKAGTPNFAARLTELL